MSGFVNTKIYWTSELQLARSVKDTILTTAMRRRKKTALQALARCGVKIVALHTSCRE